MNKSCFAVKPTSRRILRNKAKAIRLTYSLDDNIKLDVVRFLEHVLTDVFPSLSVEIVEKFDGEKDKCGEFDFLQDKIRIPEERYRKAIEGDGRARFDILHECSHKMLITPKSMVFCQFARKLKNFEDPEWQADCLAGELLMPIDKIRGMSIEEVAEYCGVTKAAAKFQLSKIYL